MTITDFNEFVWFVPQEQNPYRITIPNENIINLNPNLMKLIPDRVAIGVDKLNRICIRQNNDGYKIPKSGTVKDKRIISMLTDNSLSLPARFDVTIEEDCWIAVLTDAPHPPPNNPMKPRTKIRQRGLGNLIDGETGI